jgi:hypothetical protein
MRTFCKIFLTCVNKVLCVIFFCGLLMVSNRGQAQDDALEIGGTPFRACVVAYKDFETKGWDVRNFIVRVKRVRTGYEVTFEPRQERGKATVRGGRTAFGQEMSYVVSDDGRIVAVHYAR